MSFAIYVIAGRHIFEKRKQLRAFQTYTCTQEETALETPLTGLKTTAIHVFSESAAQEHVRTPDPASRHESQDRIVTTSQRYEPYSITIGRGSADHTVAQRPPLPCSRASNIRQNNAAMDANTAAWGYTKCAILFFLSLLVTWVCSFISCTFASIFTTHLHHCPPALPFSPQSPFSSPQLTRIPHDRSHPPSIASTPSPDPTSSTGHSPTPPASSSLLWDSGTRLSTSLRPGVP